ncbi:MAG: MFS transporter [Caldilineaceae bacterium]
MRDNSSIIYSIYIPTFLLAFCRGLLVPVLPLYAASFDVSYALVGLVLASEGLGTLVGDLPAGILIGRLGRKRSMIIGIVTMIVSILAFGLARSAVELMIYGFFLGLGGAMWNISRHAYLADAAPSAGRGKAIAVFGGINRIGTFAGPLLGGALGAAFGLRVPFFLYAAVGAIALFFPLRFVERRGYRPPERGTMKEHFALTGAMIREHFRSLTTAGSGQLFAQMIRSGRNIVIPLYAADVLGLSVDQVGLVVGVAAAVDMSLFFVAGYVMDRFGRKFAYVPSFAIQGIGMALVPFTAGFGSLLVASSIIGLGNGLGSGTMMTLGADLAPVESRGEFLGVWRLIGDGGSAGGPMVVGAVADLLGLSLATFTIAGVGLLAAAMLGTLVPETLQKKIV